MKYKVLPVGSPITFYVDALCVEKGTGIVSKVEKDHYEVKLNRANTRFSKGKTITVEFSEVVDK